MEGGKGSNRVRCAAAEQPQAPFSQGFNFWSKLFPFLGAEAGRQQQRTGTAYLAPRQSAVLDFDPGLHPPPPPPPAGREEAQEEEAEEDLQQRLKRDSMAVALTKLAVARQHRASVVSNLYELRRARQDLLHHQASVRRTSPPDARGLELESVTDEMQRLRALDDEALRHLADTSNAIVAAEEMLLSIDHKISKLVLR